MEERVGNGLNGNVIVQCYERSQDAVDIHGIHQAILRGYCQRNHRHEQERECDV